VKRLSDLIWSAVFWVYGRRAARQYARDLRITRKWARKWGVSVLPTADMQAKVRTEWLRRARDERG
jgi:hypothetical protein